MSKIFSVEHVRVANVKKPKEGRAYCISHVYINGVYSHDTIEDEDRGLDQSMSAAQVAKIKVQDKTAIPTGTYTVKMNVKSPRYSQKEYYKKFCDGIMPRLDPVVGFLGILIHPGKDETWSSGCIIVGLNKKVGAVVDTYAVFERFYKALKAASDRGDIIKYTITRKYKV